MKLTLHKICIESLFSSEILGRFLGNILEFLLFEWMLTLTHTLKEALETWHIRKNAFELLDLFLGKAFTRSKGSISVFLSFLSLRLSHLLHVVSIDILVLSFTEIFILSACEFGEILGCSLPSLDISIGLKHAQLILLCEFVSALGVRISDVGPILHLLHQVLTFLVVEFRILLNSLSRHILC